MLLKSICHMGGVQYMNKLLPLSCTRPMSFGVFTECVFIGDLSKRHVGTRKLLSKLQASLKMQEQKLEVPRNSVKVKNYKNRIPKVGGSCYRETQTSYCMDPAFEGQFC